MVLSPSIGLYVHLPWCVKKCPYCDFNSHQLVSQLDESTYIDALLNDFWAEIDRLGQERIITTIFIGGGTPSLFSAESINKLLNGIKKRAYVLPNAEITIETNPGVTDQSRFKGYLDAGVNRLSIGIQSFNSKHLVALGRIHNCEQAFKAVEMAKVAGFGNINLDLMYCLPGQSIEMAQQDINQAIALSPTHISAYQLTIEPNTIFALSPPKLPEENTGWLIQQTYWAILKKQGYHQYEISAYSQPGYECRHNLGYWRFDDYLGIGAGAHGKITLSDGVYRTLKPKHPASYLRDMAQCSNRHNNKIKKVRQSDLPLEYMMNKLRLDEGFTLENFEALTGLDRVNISLQLNMLVNKSLLIGYANHYTLTEKGKLFLNDVLQIFLPDNSTGGLKKCCG